jgi:hypothetical protein
VLFLGTSSWDLFCNGYILSSVGGKLRRSEIVNSAKVPGGANRHSEPSLVSENLRHFQLL